MDRFSTDEFLKSDAACKALHPYILYILYISLPWGWARSKLCLKGLYLEYRSGLIPRDQLCCRERFLPSGMAAGGRTL